MASTAMKPTKQESIMEYVSTGITIRVGGFVLRELANGEMWLENEAGEGMIVPPHLIEALLRNFHEENF